MATVSSAFTTFGTFLDNSLGLVIQDTPQGGGVGISDGTNYITDADTLKDFLWGQADAANIDVTEAKNGTISFTDSNGVHFVVADEGTGALKGGAGASTDVIFGSADDNTINSGGGEDVVYGLDGNDKINGGAGNDALFGGVGNDKIDGGADNDLIFGGDGNDNLKGGTGNDEIHGEAGADTIDGGAGIDTLYGETGRDTIKGGAGDDQIFGGSGRDTLTGGAGSDTFIFKSTDGESSHDTITDFKIGVDVIDTDDGITIAAIDPSANGKDAIVTFSDGSSVTLKGLGSKVADIEGHLSGDSHSIDNV
jgi:Ca2+-binding RTX toxin-like protein